MFLKSPWQGLSKKMAQVNLLWWPKNFNWNRHYVEGDQFFVITIWHALTIGWQLNFFSHHKERQLKKIQLPKKGAMSFFWKTFDKGFAKTYDMPPFLVTEKCQ